MNFQRELALVNFPLLIVAGTDIVSVVRCICSLLWNGSGLRALFLFRRFEYCKYLEKLSFVLWITRNRSVFPPRFISLLLCGNVKQEFFGVAPFVCLKLLATSYKSFSRKKKKKNVSVLIANEIRGFARNIRLRSICDFPRCSISFLSEKRSRKNKKNRKRKKKPILWKINRIIIISTNDSFSMFVSCLNLLKSWGKQQHLALGLKEALLARRENGVEEEVGMEAGIGSKAA